MKTKKILSLILAVLMIASVIPMTFIPATAEEATPAAVAGTAPTTLPNGKTYAAATFHTNDAAADHRANTGGNWLSGWGTAVWAMMQGGAEGVMFKVDTTNAAESISNTLTMTFAMSFTGYRADGTKMDTYLIATPAQAAGWSGNAVSTQDDKSTWYYSQDGATWNEVSTSGTHMSIPVGKQVTYVYVPFDAFWTKEGETFIKTGVNVKTDRVVNYYDALEMIDDAFRLGSIRHLISGGATNPARDTTVTINEWKIVDHVQAVEDMSKDLVFLPGFEGSVPKPSWTGGSWYLPTAENSLKNANGLLVEVNSEGTAATAFSLMMSINRGDGSFNNAYLLSSYGRANAFGTSYKADEKGDAAWEQSSVAYWSEDGVNWTAIASGTNITAPKAATKAYVYVPFESWYTRHAEKDIGKNSALSAQRVDKDDMMAALDDGWQFGYIHTYDNTNVTSYTNWRFVYDEETAPKRVEAPTKLPDGSYYTSNQMFLNNERIYSSAINNGSWGGFVASPTHVNDLNNAEGIMFKVDASGVAAGNDTLQMAFDLNVAGANGKYTYLASNIGQAIIHGNTVAPSGATSTWYISLNGQTWTSVSGTARYFNTGCSERGEFYIYIPFSSMYTRYGTTYLSGGSSVSTESSLTYAQAKALVGGFTSMSNFAVRFNSTVMNGAAIKEFAYVTKSSTPPTPTELPDDLPVVGKSEIKDFLTQQIPRPNWHSQGYFKATAEADFLNAKGVMFEIDSSAMTTADPIQMSFFLSPSHTLGGNGGNNYLFAVAGQVKDYANSTADASMISTWYYSEDGVNWRALTANYKTNRMTLPAKHTHMYIYVPMTSFYSRYTEAYITGQASSSVSTDATVRGDRMQEILAKDFNFAYIHGYFGSNTSSAAAQISNWRFVMDENPRENIVAEQLPEGVIYSDNAFYKDSFDVMSLYYNKTSVLPEGSDFAKTDWFNSSILATGATSAIKAGAEGIMFKVDTSNATVDSNLLSFTFALQVKFGSTSTYILATPKQAANLADAKYLDGASSTWYYSLNGYGWTPATVSTTSYNTLPLGKGVAYVYIPMDAFWFKTGKTHLSGGTLDKTETIVNWNEGKQYLGDNWTLSMSCFWFGGKYTEGNQTLAQDPNVKITDWTTVAEVGLKTQSTTLKNDFTYNVYANNAETTEVTFTMGGQTYEAVGVAQSNGTVKYSFENLLPQQLAEEITTTWTTTLASGRKLTETKTFSVYDYLKTTLADESLADWHELAQATINYAAAVQAREGSGFKGEPIPAEDVKPLENAVTDYTTLEGYDTISLALGAESGFNSAALLLEGTILMKISVADTVTSITYEINGRTGTAAVENGAAYVPINAHEMADTLTVKDANNEADVLTVSVNWYIANVVPGGANTTNLINAIANYGVAAAKMK